MSSQAISIHPQTTPESAHPAASPISHQAIFHYKTAMAEFRKWLACGAVTFDDLCLINAAVSAKHGLSPKSIFLDVIHKPHTTEPQ